MDPNSFFIEQPEFTLQPSQNEQVPENKDAAPQIQPLKEVDVPQLGNIAGESLSFNFQQPTAAPVIPEQKSGRENSQILPSFDNTKVFETSGADTVQITPQTSLLALEKSTLDLPPAEKLFEKDIPGAAFTTDKNPLEQIPGTPGAIRNVSPKIDFSTGPTLLLDENLTNKQQTILPEQSIAITPLSSRDDQQTNVRNLQRIPNPEPKDIGYRIPSQNQQVAPVEGLIKPEVYNPEIPQSVTKIDNLQGPQQEHEVREIPHEMVVRLHPGTAFYLDGDVLRVVVQ